MKIYEDFSIHLYDDGESILIGNGVINLLFQHTDDARALVDAINELRAERDKLKAELDAIKKPEPVTGFDLEAAARRLCEIRGIDPDFARTPAQRSHDGFILPQASCSQSPITGLPSIDWEQRRWEMYIAVITDAMRWQEYEDIDTSFCMKHANEYTDAFHKEMSNEL